MLVRHKVEDYGTWRKVYDAFDVERRTMGVIGDSVFQSVDDPNDVTVWHDFESAEEARAFVSSDALRRAMQEAGVQGQPEIWFVRES
jgi:heme-degrading monooxygenase HmoA